MKTLEFKEYVSNWELPYMINPIDLTQKFSLFNDHWQPKIVAELNGQYVKLAKLKGEFVWHHHENEDELFMVIKGKLTIKLRDQPGWVTFSIDGSLGYPSTGEIIDVNTKKIVAVLTDETGREVHSEKMLEIDFFENDAIRTGDQFGYGRLNGEPAALLE